MHLMPLKILDYDRSTSPDEINRSDFVRIIGEGKIHRRHLVWNKERLLQLGIPLQPGDVDLCETIF